MARRKAQYVFLCEDQQLETFARTVLKEMKLASNPANFAWNGPLVEEDRQNTLFEAAP